MKQKVLTFLKTTLKATSTLLSAATAVSAATFVPEPWNGYAAAAVVVLSWVVTYFVPFLTQTVETFPEEVWPDEAGEPVVHNEILEAEGEIVEPLTVEMEALPPVDTVGIPVIEGETAESYDPGGPTVEEIINRLIAEGGLKDSYAR